MSTAYPPSDSAPSTERSPTPASSNAVSSESQMFVTPLAVMPSANVCAFFLDLVDASAMPKATSTR